MEKKKAAKPQSRESPKKSSEKAAESKKADKKVGKRDEKSEKSVPEDVGTEGTEVVDIEISEDSSMISMLT